MACGSSVGSCATIETFPSCKCGSNNCSCNSPKIYYSQIYGAVQIADIWNTPKCGNQVIVHPTNLDKFPVNGYLWNVTYGYFRIVSYNSLTNALTLINFCQDVTQTAGKQVPAHSLFVLVGNPDNQGGVNVPYLAIDFTAPGVGGTSIIKFTFSAPFSNGALITIGGYSYTINTIYNDTTFQVINDLGLGAPPGTIFKALNILGEYQYPILVSQSQSVLGTVETFLVPGTVVTDGNPYVLYSYVNILNPSPIYPLKVFVRSTLGVAGQVINGQTEVPERSYSFDLTRIAPNPPSTSSGHSLREFMQTKFDSLTWDSGNVNLQEVYTIGPNSMIGLRFRMILICNSALGTVTYTVDHGSIKTDYIGLYPFA